MGKYAAGVSRPHAAARTPRRRRFRPHADGARPCAYGLDGLLDDVFDNIPETRLDQLQARDSISCDTIQGAIARLSAAVAHMDSSVCKKNNSSSEAAYTNEASDDSPNSQPQGSHNYSSNIAATAYGNHKVPGEMRQSYGFNTLISQSVFLADGTERRYYALPEDYPLESSSVVGKVGVTAPPCVEEQATGLTPIICSKANITAGSESLLIPNLQWPMDVQDDPHVFKEAPVYDTYEEEDSVGLNTTSNVQDFTCEQQPYKEQQECGQLLKCVGKAPVFDVYDFDGCSNEFVHVFSSTPEQQSYEEEEQDSEKILKCVKAQKTEQTIAYLNYLTDVQQRHGVQKASVHVQQLRDPQSNVSVIHEKRKEWNPGASALLHLANSQFDEELGYVAMLVPKALNFCNQVGTSVQQLVTHESEKEWDPGEETILSSILNRDLVSVQYHTTQVMLVLSARFIRSTKNHLADWELMTDTYTKVANLTWYNSLPGPLFILLGSSTYTWDPGVHIILHSYPATHPLGTRYGFFTQVLQPIFASAVKCFIAFGLEWTEVNAAVVLGLLVTCSKGKSVAQLSLCSSQTTTIAGQTIIFRSSTAKSLQMTKHKHPREFFLLAELQNGSDIRDGQLAYTPQGTSINPREWVGHMVTVLSCWSLSFETAKLQWNPGIASVYRKGVQKNYSAKNLLFSENYLRTWEMDIIFITFLPP